MGPDPEWVKNIEKKIDAIPDCSILNEVMDAIVEYMQKVMEDQIKSMQSMLPLTKIPKDLDEVIDWIKSYVDKATKAYNAAVAELAAWTAVYTSLMGKIAAKAASIQGCTVPTPPAPPIPGS